MTGQLVAKRGAAALQYGSAQYFLEVNVRPGMTETSTLPMALDVAGRDLGAVCRDLLGQAAARGT